MSDAKVYRKGATLKRYAIYVLFIIILVASNFATVYVYSLIDEVTDLKVRVVELEAKNERLVEHKIQLEVANQELTEPDL